MEAQVLTPPEAAEDFLPINGTDYVEFYVGNAKQAAHFYANAFGFQIRGYRGPETGYREAASYLLQQDKIRFVLTSPLYPDNFIADHPHLNINLTFEEKRALQPKREGAERVHPPMLAHVPARARHAREQ